MRSKEPTFNKPENDHRPTPINFLSSIFGFLPTNMSKLVLIYKTIQICLPISYWILEMIRAGLHYNYWFWPSFEIGVFSSWFQSGANQIGQLCFRVMDRWQLRSKVKSWGGATRGLDTTQLADVRQMCSPSLSFWHKRKFTSLLFPHFHFFNPQEILLLTTCYCPEKIRTSQAWLHTIRLLDFFNHNFFAASPPH